MRRIPRPTRSTLFPYTTLFRSVAGEARQVGARADLVHPAPAASPGCCRTDLRGRERSLVARAARTAQGRSRLRRRSEEHTSELQSLAYLVCRLLLEKKKDRICS